MKSEKLLRLEFFSRFSLTIHYSLITIHYSLFTGSQAAGTMEPVEVALPENLQSIGIVILRKVGDE